MYPQAPSPLPLAGEVGSQSDPGGGSLHTVTRGNTPTPTLPRKREREHSRANQPERLRRFGNKQTVC
jgi:hypothetical protein